MVVLLLVTPLVALAAAELALRWLSPSLPRPLRWHTRLLEHKVDQMDEAALFGGVDLIVAGSSMPFVGIDTDAVCAGAGISPERAHNAAFFRAFPDVSERWLIEEVEPRLRPSVLVYALSSIEMNDASKLAAGIKAAYGRAVMTRSDWKAKLMLAVEERSALVRHRRKLTHRRDYLVDGLKRKLGRLEALPPRTEEMAGILGDRGNGVETRHWEFRLSDRRKAWVRSDVTNDYTTGGFQAAALTRIIRSMQARNVRVVLALMPVNEEFFALYPNGQADHERGRDAITTVARATGVPVVDPGADLTDTRYFGDSFHFNGLGAQVYSERLGRALAPLLERTHDLAATDR